MKELPLVIVSFRALLSHGKRTVSLRDVVAEGGEHHIVNGVWRNSKAYAAPLGRPCILDHVGILDAPLQSALRPLVILVPKADGAFNDVLHIAIASATGSRSILFRRKSCCHVAPRVVA